MAKIAQTIGLDPAEARSIDVVASLFYTVLCRQLLRAANSNGRADDRLVGMLQVLLKALDPAELRITGAEGGPVQIAAVVANVQTALGMRPADALTAPAPANASIDADELASFACHDSNDSSAEPDAESADPVGHLPAHPDAPDDDNGHA